ncbi:hypothetical protein JTB14_011636 [Gonioctena quinquepunctata]|nr:hypothetical protein JTB14_011636 [Gonioctena quinquepunctata]
MSTQIEKSEADSTTWSLADGVEEDNIVMNGPIQDNFISSTTLDMDDIEFNGDNGRFLSLIVDNDDDDDADSDATIGMEEGSDDGADEPDHYYHYFIFCIILLLC